MPKPCSRFFGIFPISSALVGANSLRSIRSITTDGCLTFVTILNSLREFAMEALLSLAFILRMWCGKLQLY
jgi:hypothetical protein